jgi:hypothetical protein
MAAGGRGRFGGGDHGIGHGGSFAACNAATANSLRHNGPAKMQRLTKVPRHKTVPASTSRCYNEGNSAMLASVSRLLLVTATIAAAAPAAATTLQTPMFGGNGQDGIMFDILVGGSALTLESIGINANGGTFDFAFYTIAGGVGGNANNAAAWTLRDSFTSVTTAGDGNFTILDITDLGLSAGATYGLYITAINGGVNYTDGNFVGEVIASNADLAILSGYGKGYPFADTFSPRNFNGSLTYSTGLPGGVPEPASWAMMIGGFGLVGTSLRRRRASFSAA